jgi:hypothetical protein
MQNYHSLRLYPKKKQNCFDVCLELPFQSRFIGELNLSGEGTFTCKRSETKHLFNKLNSLGLNYQLLKSEKVSFKWIVIIYTEKNGNHVKLVTSRNYFLHHGYCYEFANRGFELQCFLELEKFGIEKARLFESQSIIQENLFEDCNARKNYQYSL